MSRDRRAEQQHLGLQESLLAFLSYLGKKQVPLVAVALGGVERLRGDPGAAFVLPLVEPARHRGDVAVAELAERLGGQRRAGAPGAVDDDLAVLVGHPAFHLELEEAAGQVDGTGQRTLGVLVRLADVEEERLSKTSSAAPGSISTMSLFTWLSISLKLGTRPTSSPAFVVLKPYRRARLSRTGGPASAPVDCQSRGPGRRSVASAEWNCTRSSASAA